MPGYWWQCENCRPDSSFLEACGSKSIAHFIWDVLLPSSWDQSKLLLHCKNCGQQSIRITYEFPRKEKEVFRVIHIVGIGPLFDEYIPMMWETYQVGNGKGEVTLFDFKYIGKRSVWGLNKPAVFSRDDLKRLFALFCEKTGSLEFP